MFAKFFGKDPSKWRQSSGDVDATGGARAAASPAAAHAPTQGAPATVSPPSGAAPGERNKDLHQDSRRKVSSHSLSQSTRLLHPVKDAAEITWRLQVGAYNISSVSIPQYRVKGSYVEYVVECTQGSACWRVYRRYQQFKALDQALRPLCARGTPNHGDYGVLPMLPGSHWMEVTNQSPELVDRRRRFLEIYLQQLLVPRNLFYITHTALYGFLHDGEVPVDVKVVSVQPLLGIGTLNALPDDSGSPFQSPTDMSLGAAAGFVQRDAARPDTTAPANANEQGAGGAADDSSGGSDAPPSVHETETFGIAVGSGSPLRLEADTTIPFGASAAAPRSDEHLSQEQDGAVGPHSLSSQPASAASSASSSPLRTSSPSATAAPATANGEEGFSGRKDNGPTSLTTSAPEFEEVSAWDSEDGPSEDERDASQFAALPSVRHGFHGSGGGGGGVGGGGQADERLPPPAPNCQHCSRDFNSTLYPHRCYFCRARFCRNCLWHLRLATGTAPPVAEAMASPTKLRKTDTSFDARGASMERTCAAVDSSALPHVVNACFQCTENYHRRWNRHNGDEHAFSGEEDTLSNEVVAGSVRVGCQAKRSKESAVSQPVRSQDKLPQPSRSAAGGGSSSSASATSTSPQREREYEHPVHALCTPSLRPQDKSWTTAAATASAQSADGLSSAGPPWHGDLAHPRAQGHLDTIRPYLGKLSVLAPSAPMRVGLHDFQLLTCLGRGTFGKVMKVKLRATDTVYAMKVMNKSVVYKRYMTSYIKEEKNILTSLPPHPYVVRCHFAFQSEYYLFFILDYLPGGELYDLMYPTLRITPQEARLYAAELVLAIEHIHTYDVVHRDIKPENIVLDGDGHIKLTDFGLARKNFSHTRRRSFVGSAEYVAPETIQGEYQTPALDWWSLGVLLYEMLAGQAPFHADNNNAVYDNVLHKEPDLSNTRVFSPEASSLILGLLTRDVASRLQDGEAIRSHPYFAGMDWDALRAKEVPAPRVPYLAENDVRHFKREFTAEWASVPLPAQVATRNSIEMLHRCFDNFPVARSRGTAASAAATEGQGSTTAATADPNLTTSFVGPGATGTMPPSLRLEDGPATGSDVSSFPTILPRQSGDPHGTNLSQRRAAPSGEPSADCVDGEKRNPHHHPLHVSDTKSNIGSYTQVASLLHPRSLSRGLCSSPSVGSLSTGAAPLPGQSQADLLGVWRLLKVETCALDGRVIYPWGGDVVGILVYLPTGDYAMQLCPLRRRRLRHRHVAHATKEELSDVFCSYAAQFGTFTVAPETCASGAATVTGSGDSMGSVPTAAEAASGKNATPPPHATAMAAGAEEQEEEFDMFKTTTAVVWHRVEGNLCPNLAQRVVKMRFDTEATSPLPRQTTTAVHVRAGSAGSEATLANPPSSNSNSRVNTPQPVEAASAAAKNVSPLGGRVYLRLMTEPEVVTNESFKARTVMTWQRVKPFAQSSTAAAAAPSSSPTTKGATMTTTTPSPAPPSQHGWPTMHVAPESR